MIYLQVKNMAAHNELGEKGEQLAVDYLTNNAYTILATNWRTGHLEIDIIAKKDNILAFVEVKTRSTTYFGMPEEFVSPDKQKKIINAAEIYMKLEATEDYDVQFDIIAIVIESKNPTINHIEDAYYPYDL